MTALVSRSWARSVGLALGLAFALGFMSGSHAAEIDEAKASAVKAAFLYKFTKFVDWPDKAFSSSEAPFVIGVVGKARIESVLRRVVDGKKVGNRPMKVKSFKVEDKEQAKAVLSSCQVLFIPQDEKKVLPKILGAVTTGVLVVSDNRRFCESGGHIELKLKDGRYLLRINLERTKKSGLRVSSKILRLAEIVKSDK